MEAVLSEMYFGISVVLQKVFRDNSVITVEMQNT